jgi:DNA polymerase elongation subunit (family B)
MSKKAKPINKPRILLIDIETSPLIVYAWSLFDKYIPVGNIVEPGHTLCFAAKWLGEKEVIYDSVDKSRPGDMIRRVWKLLDEADAVVHYNGKRFDIPVLESEFLLHKLKPPSPTPQIDLLQTARRFRLPSRKLDYISKRLGLGQKVQHKGMELWRQCMAGDSAAWKIMERYNRQDVKLLEDLYHVLLPWIKGHPNMSLYRHNEDDEVCPYCGSKHIRWKGYRVTATGRYRRFVCNDCGGWGQANVRDKETLSATTKAYK